MYVCGFVVSIVWSFMAMVRRKWTFAHQRSGANGDITKLRKILLDSCITISFKRIIRKQFHIKLLVILHLSIIWTETNYLGSLIFHPCSYTSSLPYVTLFGHCTCKEVGCQCGSGGGRARVCRSSHEISPRTRQTNWFFVQILLHL